jgi:putative acetyltransferase
MKLIGGVHPVRADEGDRLLDVWETSVRATHHFLTEADIQFFRPLVLPELFALGYLMCVREEGGSLVGFVGGTGEKLEGLFIHPACHRAGIGRRLVNYAFQMGSTLVDVNEQNPEAVEFYRQLGFEVAGRSALDPSGKPFPLLHMRQRSCATV